MVARSSTATCAASGPPVGGDGKEHRQPTRQHLWPEVIELAARLGGACQHGDVATVCRHTLQASGRIQRGKDNRVIRRPGRSVRTPKAGIEYRLHRPTDQGHLLQRAALIEPDPLAVGRDEDPVQRGSACDDRLRVEPIERADEELSAVVAHVDDARAIGRDRQTAIAVGSDRRRARRCDWDARDARRRGLCLPRRPHVPRQGDDGDERHDRRDDRDRPWQTDTPSIDARRLRRC